MSRGRQPANPGHARPVLREHWRSADALLRRLQHDLTPEDVHTARVAIRRLRTILSGVAPALDAGLLARVRNDLQDVASGLGRVRDADIRCEILLPDAASPLLSALRAERRNARRCLRRQLRDPAMTARLQGVSRIIDGEKLFKDSADADRALADAVRRRCRKLARSLRRDSASPARRHALRIRVKKCRYLLDACVVRKHPRRARKILALLCEFQDCLGELNDVEQTLQWLADQDLPARITNPRRAALRAQARQSRSRLEQLCRRLRPHEITSLYR